MSTGQLKDPKHNSIKTEIESDFKVTIVGHFVDGVFCVLLSTFPSLIYSFNEVRFEGIEGSEVLSKQCPQELCSLFYRTACTD